MTFLALGYLRRDVSRRHQHWDESQIRWLAGRLGYNLCKTVALSNRTCDPIQQLIDAVVRLDAEAVVVPSLDHFADRVIPADLLAITDVVTVTPEHTYARWASGELPELKGT
ncbi:hypothetical protein J2W56_003858 [Nocardia kruczakiae]|uniref:Resolvase-like protein n=1 Tax=Nocardia kruczakiae TaxID=261477 RepID=A0ABU1XHT1_9NOCA|nr:hypothetical protein [Nocardia kruczakiae]MDR7170107.1 hypothetical protein [Nocardia kruczakiae]